MQALQSKDPGRLDDVLEAAVRRRLGAGAAAAEIVALLRPPPPLVENTLPRQAGPEGASWMRQDAPLLGLSYLQWRKPSPALQKRIQADLTDGVVPLAVRVAQPSVLGGWWLAHAMFGTGDLVDYDVLGVVAPSRPKRAPGIVKIGWRGDSVAQALRESQGDLAACPEDYLRLFCALIATEPGRFPIVDREDAGPARRRSIPLRDEQRDEMCAVLATRPPIEFVGIWPNGSFRYRATIFYDGALQLCEFELGHEGRVVMTDETILWEPGQGDGQ